MKKSIKSGKADKFFLRTIKVLALCLLCLLITNIGEYSAQAAEKAAVVGTVVEDNHIYTYAKGFSTTDSIEVLIGNKKVNSINVLSVSENSIPMKTLVLLDNSVDTANDSQVYFNTFLENYIAAKSNFEQISIAAFGEKVTTIIDYTNDYIALINAFKGISYAQQKTLTTDVMYELVEKNAEINENSYRRIILLSDGFEDESIGYTNDELYKLIEKNPIPIYVLGCKTKNNSSLLEQAFVLSRKSGAKSYILNDYEDMLDIAEELKDDEKVVCVDVLLNSSMMDGSEKTMKLSNGSCSATIDIRLPQSAEEEEEEESVNQIDNSVPQLISPNVSDTDDIIEIAPDDLYIIEDDTDPAEENLQEASQSKKSGKKNSVSIFDKEDNESEKSFFTKIFDFIKEFWIYFTIGAGVLVIIIILIIVLLVRRKNRKKSDQSMGGFVQMPMPDINNDQMDGTVKIGFEPDIEGEEGTVKLWESNTSFVSLTDVDKPGLEFRQIINGFVTIGRSASKNMIVINYDKSISGQHCKISLRDGMFFITDSGSSNGTFVNNERIFGEKQILNGDIIKLGQTTLRFEGIQS
ncbi:MAG: FHA domain-containing protein [Lachnospiraceae bacterium]|nr:FHA domain-containing protein [Lachnospiraceae bacterium]